MCKEQLNSIVIKRFNNQDIEIAIPQKIMKDIPILFNEMLKQAELLFGERISGYEIGWIEYKTIYSIPTYFITNDKKLILRIPDYVCSEYEKDFYNGIQMIAHECIHLLTPRISAVAKVTILEEGLATYFSAKFVNDKYNYFIQCNKEYTDAKNAISELLEFDKDIIKKIRLRQPEIRLSSITSGEILKENPLISINIINKLIKEF